MEVISAFISPLRNLRNTSNGSSMIRFDGTNDRMEVGTILSTSSEIEVFLVAHKEASDGETFQRIISSFGSGSSNDWTAPNWHIHKYVQPGGITSSFDNRLFNPTYLSHKIQNLRIGVSLRNQLTIIKEILPN